MSKTSKDERIRQLKIASELEDIQAMLVTAETHLAGITATVNKVICDIVEEGGVE